MAKDDAPARTSLNLPKTLVTQARHAALEEGRSFSALVAEAIRQYLKEHGRGKK